MASLGELSVSPRIEVKKQLEKITAKEKFWAEFEVAENLLNTLLH
jgi:hypothetical protein